LLRLLSRKDGAVVSTDDCLRGGLIGGSLALIARRAGVVGKVVGLGRSQANLDVAVEREMIDVATRDPVEAARGADLIVLAVPIMTMRLRWRK